MKDLVCLYLMLIVLVLMRIDQVYTLVVMVEMIAMVESGGMIGVLNVVHQTMLKLSLCFGINDMMAIVSRIGVMIDLH